MLICLPPELFIKKIKCEEVKKLEVLPLLPYHYTETSVTLTCVVGAIHEGLGARQILAAYHLHLVGTE